MQEKANESLPPDEFNLLQESQASIVLCAYVHVFVLCSGELFALTLLSLLFINSLSFYNCLVYSKCIDGSEIGDIFVWRHVESGWKDVNRHVKSL